MLSQIYKSQGYEEAKPGISGISALPNQEKSGNIFCFILRFPFSFIPILAIFLLFDSNLQFQTN